MSELARSSVREVSDRGAGDCRPGILGIVVVNYGSSRLLEENLGAVDLHGLPVRVVVVDNFSGDQERAAVAVLAEAQGWDLVALPGNRGFGAGVNAGIEVARALGCECFLLLNPDARVTAEVVDELRRYSLAHPDALVSPRIVAPDGSNFFRGAQVSLIDGRVRGHGSDGRHRLPAAHAEDWVSGACLAVSDALLRRIGPLAEHYFLYWEDIDLSHRCLQAGGSLVVRTGLVAVHDAGGTQGARRGRAKSALYYRYNCRNRLRFAATHLSRRRLLRWVLATPAVSWEVLRRGGRRQLLVQPALAWAAIAGSLAGVFVAMAAIVGRRPGQQADVPTVLVAHPGAELYGSDRMAVEGVAGLLAAGRRVVVTVPTDGPLVAVMAELGADVRICPTPVLRKSVLSPAGMVGLALDSARGAVRGFGLLREIRPGALYVSTMTVPLWTVLGRLLRIPVTVHVHEAERSAAGWIRWAMSLPVALAHRVLVNSEYSRDVLLESAPGVRDRTSLVRNGVSGPPEVTAPRPRLDGALRLIFVGRLSPRKGPQVAVALLAELRRRGIDATLVLAGSVFPGYEPFEAELHEHVRRENLVDRVAFLGFVDDVWALLRDCDVALVPSLLDEPFGNTAVEALLAARPVIVSDTSGLREATFGYRAATTVPPGDVGAWASAVEALVDRWDANRSAVLEDAVEAARRHAPEHFRSRVAELTTLRRGATR